MTLTDAEALDFAASAADSVRARWPDATGAGDAALDQIWPLAAEQGWFDLGSYGELATVLALVRELGRLACPFPLVDGYVAAWLAGTDSELARALSDASVRVIAAQAPRDQRVPFAEAASSATHALVFGDDDSAVLCPIRAVCLTPGLAAPAWHEVIVGEPDPAYSFPADRAPAARAALRLGLAVRAAAAAERTHELAIEHARSRTQFGRLIGGFGAVQQRIATAQIDVSASRALVGLALDASGTDAFGLAVALATGHVANAAPRVQLAAQHTLAAIGYFDEHEGPWLFRRVHADVARIRLFERPGEQVGDRLVETTATLPAVTAEDGPAEALRARLRDLFATYAEQARHDGERARLVLRDAMIERGYFGMGWPPEHGGRAASVAEQVVLNDEIQYHRAPVRDEMSTVMLLGNAIVRHGTPEQQADFLPRIARGEIRFCLGYSEPEVGSDLASLRTRAVRDGCEWVITGQKAWTTNAHLASHIWLACRSDPEAEPRHAGITVFLVPMDTRAITVQRHTALSGEVSCSVFFDDVRVPDRARVGAVDGGWKVITDALAGERVVMGSVAAILRRQFDDLLAVVRADVDRHAGPRGSARRARLGDLAIRLQATRALVAHAVGATSGGRTNLEAPMAAVLGGEVAEEFGETLLELFGPDIALAGGAGWPEQVEYYLRLSIMYVVGGGTNDIQRGLISRALGLPR